MSGISEKKDQCLDRIFNRNIHGRDREEAILAKVKSNYSSQKRRIIKKVLKQYCRPQKYSSASISVASPMKMSNNMTVIASSASAKRSKLRFVSCRNYLTAAMSGDIKAPSYPIIKAVGRLLSIFALLHHSKQRGYAMFTSCTNAASASEVKVPVTVLPRKWEKLVSASDKGRVLTAYNRARGTEEDRRLTVYDPSFEWDCRSFSYPAKYYMLEELIGYGATGLVYRAKDENEDSVAIKILASKTKTEQNLATREIKAHEKASTGKEASNSNTVILHNHGSSYCGQEKYLVIEYCDGGEVRSSSLASMNIETKLQLIQHILAAVAYLHSLGMVYLDIKLENIFIMLNGDNNKKNPAQWTFKLGDFGTARFCAKDARLRDEVVGTRGYRSWEVIRASARDRSYNGFQADLWSVGILVFEVLYNHLPFGAETNGLEKLHDDFEAKQRKLVRGLSSSLTATYDYDFAHMVHLRNEYLTKSRYFEPADEEITKRSDKTRVQAEITNGLDQVLNLKRTSVTMLDDELARAKLLSLIPRLLTGERNRISAEDALTYLSGPCVSFPQEQEASKREEGGTESSQEEKAVSEAQEASNDIWSFSKEDNAEDEAQAIEQSPNRCMRLFSLRRSARRASKP